ncbi:hypothetical protein HRbin36_01202 [bacterium HR36]|nr:hypothetical protein HRbin36_01202 [bacterium HR36]
MLQQAHTCWLPGGSLPLAPHLLVASAIGSRLLAVAGEPGTVCTRCLGWAEKKY